MLIAQRGKSMIRRNEQVLSGDVGLMVKGWPMRFHIIYEKNANNSIIRYNIVRLRFILKAEAKESSPAKAGDETK